MLISDSDMRMKKLISIIFVGAIFVGFSSCSEDFDEPETTESFITSPTSIGTTNTTIYDLKNKYKSLMTSSNSFEVVNDDIIFEGVVAANDGEQGNLYQTILLRDSDSTTGTDAAIELGIKNTCLYPYFPLGQRVKVNLNGLYIGVYSKVAKVGQPYYTSQGNLRLGPMLIQYCSTNIELVGTPNTDCPECRPLQLDATWLSASTNANYVNYPQLATIEGTFKAADGSLTFAPDSEKDAGYGVDRDFIVKTGSKSVTVTVRTSTQNELSYTVLPKGKCRITGLLTYYSGWQIVLRDLNDLVVL